MQAASVTGRGADLCDRLLVLVPGGKVAFFGPPRDGLRDFLQPGWAEVFQAFEAEPGALSGAQVVLSSPSASASS